MGVYSNALQIIRINWVISRYFLLVYFPCLLNHLVPLHLIFAELWFQWVIEREVFLRELNSLLCTLAGLQSSSEMLSRCALFIPFYLS